MHRALPLSLLPLLVAAGERTPLARPVRTPREARTIAEKHTGGLSVSARIIPLNGATSGWEVDVHMPRDDRGWRCIVDSDSHTVYTKTRIPNPPCPKARP